MRKIPSDMFGQRRLKSVWPVFFVRTKPPPLHPPPPKKKKKKKNKKKKKKQKKKHCVLGYPKCTKWRFWSDCANAQADLNLRWAHMFKGTFSVVTAIIIWILTWDNVSSGICTFSVDSHQSAHPCSLLIQRTTTEGLWSVACPCDPLCHMYMTTDFIIIKIFILTL